MFEKFKHTCVARAPSKRELIRQVTRSSDAPPRILAPSHSNRIRDGGPSVPSPLVPTTCYDKLQAIACTAISLVLGVFMM